MKKILKILSPKLKKLDFWDQRMKNDQIIENFRKKFMVGIDLEWSKTCFKRNIDFENFFPIENFFQRQNTFFGKIGDQKLKIFRNFFRSESI